MQGHDSCVTPQDPTSAGVVSAATLFDFTYPSTSVMSGPSVSFVSAPPRKGLNARPELGSGIVTFEGLNRGLIDGEFCNETLLE